MIQSDALFDNKKEVFLQKSVHFFLANEHTIYPLFIEKKYYILLKMTHKGTLQRDHFGNMSEFHS